MKRILFIAAFLLLNSITAQEQKPKLVVGIVVDQMRYDYLTRFWDQYEDGGFKRMINDGFNFKNNHFNYIPTKTAPGHASVFTGASPKDHGIVGNSWYDKVSKTYVYCVSDTLMEPVGTQSSAGKMSPHRMIATTFTDENRLRTQMRGKTIGVALKDRGAVLPAGHTANAAYWFHGGEEGAWITSSYYMKELPGWVKDFNSSGKAESYLKTWNTLKPIETYIESGTDENKYEAGFSGKDKATFPYDLKKLAKENGEIGIIKATPFGNAITADFAKAAVKGENLGKDDDVDVLTLSFSSTDYVGHNFGVNSKEVQDTYLRLDRTIADFLKYLDAEVGAGNYTVFLTADHAAVDVPNYLKAKKVPSGYFDLKTLNDKILAFVEENYGKNDLIEQVAEHEIFFNYSAVIDAEIEFEKLETEIARFLIQQEQIERVFTRTQMESGSFNEGAAHLMQMGFNQKRSGDVMFLLDPATIMYPETGSTHGSGYAYDTHVPLIFYGAGIPKGSTSERSEIPDIAPTISVLLGNAFPNSFSGKPLSIMLDKKSE